MDRQGRKPLSYGCRQLDEEEYLVIVIILRKGIMAAIIGGIIIYLIGCVLEDIGKR